MKLPNTGCFWVSRRINTGCTGACRSRHIVFCTECNTHIYPTGFLFAGQDRKMLRLAWSEASRSQFVAEKLGSSGRRRRKRNGKSKVVATSRFVDKERCFAMSTSANCILVVNWSNHPVLKITVSDSDDSHGPEDSCVEMAGGKGKNPCIKVHCSNFQEAAEHLRVYLFSKENLVLIGHGLERILYDWHCASEIGWKQQRCTATYPPYMEEHKDPLSVLLLPSSLDDLMQRVLKRNPSPNLLHRAAASMDLYKKAQSYWEEDLANAVEKKEESSKSAKQQQNKADKLRPSPPQKHHDLLPLNRHEKRDPPVSKQRSYTQDTAVSFSSVTSTLDETTFLSSAATFDQVSTAGESNVSLWNSTVLPSTASWSSSATVWDRQQLNVMDGSTKSDVASWVVLRSRVDSNDLDAEWVEDDADKSTIRMGPPLPRSLLEGSSDDEDGSNEKEGKRIPDSDMDDFDGDSYGGSDNNLASFRREESSHPVHGDDWLDFVADSNMAEISSPPTSSRRFTWFGRRQQQQHSEIIDEEKIVSPLDTVQEWSTKPSTSHPVLFEDVDHEGLDWHPPVTQSSFSFFRR